MKTLLILLAAGSVAFGGNYSYWLAERAAEKEQREALASQPTEGTKIMTFSATGYDPVNVEVPDSIRPGTRFVLRMPNGERVTGYLW